MKKLIYFALIAFSFLFPSCERTSWVTADTRFYIEGKEIEDDTLKVSLNSYQEIRIISYAPDYIAYDGYLYNGLLNGIKYSWRNIQNYPMYLTFDSPYLTMLSSEQSDHIQDNYEGTREVVEFRMLFADSTYQAGDLYKLRVQFCDYERTLNVLIQ